MYRSIEVDLKYREPYTLFKRKTKSGKNVYYYRTYDLNGRRTTARSTGMTSIGRARHYCQELIERGQLVPDKEMIFAAYARNWWIWGKCYYIKGKLARSTKEKPSISKRYAEDSRARLVNHILPYLGGKRLDQLTVPVIEKWLFALRDKMSAKSVNNVLSVFRIMMNEAHRQRLIHYNPMNAIKPFSEDPIERGILTIEEMRKVLNPDIWFNRVHYAMNLLAASTGMRQGEIRGLLNKHYHGYYIHVCHSYDKYGLKNTKTNEVRDIPIPSRVSEIIDEVNTHNGFVFSFSCGKNPVHRQRLTESLYVALEKIGISPDERKARNITFHSWRHFFNTYLRAANISDAKIQAVTGHRTQTITENYTKFRMDDYKEVIEVQEGLF